MVSLLASVARRQTEVMRECIPEGSQGVCVRLLDRRCPQLQCTHQTCSRCASDCVRPSVAAPRQAAPTRSGTSARPPTRQRVSSGTSAEKGAIFEIPASEVARLSEHGREARHADDASPLAVEFVQVAIYRLAWAADLWGGTVALMRSERTAGPHLRRGGSVDGRQVDLIARGRSTLRALMSARNRRGPCAPGNAVSTTLLYRSVIAGVKLPTRARPISHRCTASDASCVGSLRPRCRGRPAEDTPRVSQPLGIAARFAAW